MNGDGFDDLIVGAPGADPNGGYSGASYVIFGKPTVAVNRTGTSADEVLTGSDFADTLDGQGGNDSLIGNAGNDSLDGGTGRDVLMGGLGDDTYTVNAKGEAVERSGEGKDTVRSDTNYTLGSNIENLRLTGSQALNGTGNTLSNTITGNSASNSLQGLGGNDRLKGGDGVDTLLGGNGADTLTGGGGTDRLTGGLGNDLFAFTSPSEGGDTIFDFHNVSGDNDRIRIDAAGFSGGLVAGQPLDPEAFRAHDQNVALERDDRFIFRTTDQTLWFDADGKDGAGSVLIADLQAGATLTTSDFVLV